jgi:hypothetical protein
MRSARQDVTRRAHNCDLRAHKRPRERVFCARVVVAERRGIAFIAWTDNDDEPGFYSGYWDGGGHGPSEGFLVDARVNHSDVV